VHADAREVGEDGGERRGHPLGDVLVRPLERRHGEVPAGLVGGLDVLFHVLLRFCPPQR
jgi:hypothetical protein